MKLKLKIALTATGALALAGAGIATAAATGHGGKRYSTQSSMMGGTHGMHSGGFGHPGGGPSDDLAAAASYLGVTTSALETDLQSGKTLAQVAAATTGKTSAGLVAALVAHEQAEIAAKVTAGTLTQAQADTITAGLTQRFTDFVNGTMPVRGGPGPGGMHGPSDDLDAAASYLGVTTSALAADLQSGKTLAQVAATSGKTAAGLIAALVAHEKAEHAAAVTAGTLTQAQADAMDATLTQRYTDLVNGTRPAFGGPRDGHRP